MKNCSKCKHCYSDYFYDDEIGDEIKYDYCGKNHSVELDEDCEDYEEFKPTPYVEKYTECDKCEYLSECKSKGNYIDCTTVNDKRRHFLCSRENCRKMGV